MRKDFINLIGKLVFGTHLHINRMPIECHFCLDNNLSAMTYEFTFNFDRDKFHHLFFNINMAFPYLSISFTLICNHMNDKNTA